MPCIPIDLEIFVTFDMSMTPVRLMTTTSFLPFYQNIVLQNPGDDTAYSNLGFVYLMVGDYLKAQEAFKDALGIDPENTEAKKGLKVISENLG